MTDATTLSPEWLDMLLALPAAEARSAALQAAGLWDAPGLGRVLDQAAQLARSNPGRARVVAGVVAEAASPARAPGLYPRATYLRAQTHAINGEFAAALDYIEAARAAYVEQGEPLEALRTNIGRMHVLNELGQHAAALAAGQAVLDALPARDEPGPPARLLLALAHMNRGVCFETTGRYDDALDAYAQAEAHFTALAARERVAEVANNRAIVLTHQGRVGEALRALHFAAGLWAEAGLTLPHAQTLSNLGDAHLSLGQYMEGLRAFEQARALSAPLDAVAHKGILQRKTADAYLALNLYPEALDAYRAAVALLEQAGMADHHARALWGQGLALAALDQPADAAEALDRSGALFAAAGNTPMLSSVMLEQAALQAAQGDRAGALARAREAASLVAGGQAPVQALYAALRLSDLLLPDTAAAEPHLLEAQQLAAGLGLPIINYRLESRLGHLRQAQGRPDEAEAHLLAALRQLETLRGSLALEALRTSFLRDKAAAYADLLQLYLARDDAATAFALAERAKSRTLVDLVSGLLSPRAAAGPELTERHQALQADLSAAYNKFLDSPPEGEWAALRERVRRLEGELSQLRLRVPAAAVGADQFASALPVAALSESLPDGLSLVAYHSLGDEILAFVLRPDQVRVVRSLTTVPVVQQILQRLNAQWDRFRAGADFAQRHLAQLEQSAQRLLGALYAELVAPLEPLLAAHPAAQLAFVPHGLLHSVPFHALYDGHHYLLDRFAVSYAPSATVLALAQQRPRRAPRRAVIVGLPDALIPAAAEEARMVAAELEAAGVDVSTLAEAQATPASLAALEPGVDVLHLACHGLFRADNPMFSALKLHAGWLTAADALQLPVQDALVVLSACESGRGTVVVGDEVIGLPRAFLGAGAASVLVSLWLVPDATTAALMAHWYAALRAGQGRAEALRAAQQAVRQRHPHPYYWAPFILVGQR